MSASRKMLKIVAMLALVPAVAFVVCGVVLGACGVGGGVAISGSSMALPYGVVAGVSALVFLLAGLAGMRAANVPSHVGSACAMAIATLVAVLGNVAFWVWMGFANLDIANAVTLVLAAALAAGLFVLSGKVKKERELWH